MEVKKCPYCNKNVLAIAKVCKHCRESLDPSVPKKVERPVEPEPQTYQAYQVPSPPIIEQEPTAPVYEEEYYEKQDYYPSYTTERPKEGLGFLVWVWAILSLFMPLVGVVAFIVYLIQKKSARAVITVIAAVIGFAISAIIY